jgi:hypothetical protein
MGNRIAEFDIVDQLANRFQPASVQAVFGLACTALMVAGRVPVDVIAPTAGPFALIYPVTLIATLFGRWLAGVITATTAFLWAWYFVLPDPWSFHFARVSDVARLIVKAQLALAMRPTFC